MALPVVRPCGRGQLNALLGRPRAPAAPLKGQPKPWLASRVAKPWLASHTLRGLAGHLAPLPSPDPPPQPQPLVHTRSRAHAHTPYTHRSSDSSSHSRPPRRLTQYTGTNGVRAGGPMATWCTTARAGGRPRRVRVTWPIEVCSTKMGRHGSRGFWLVYLRRVRERMRAPSHFGRGLLTHISESTAGRLPCRVKRTSRGQHTPLAASTGRMARHSSKAVC